MNNFEKRLNKALSENLNVPKSMLPQASKPKQPQDTHGTYEGPQGQKVQPIQCKNCQALVDPKYYYNCPKCKKSLS